ncbi:cobyrinate a,c-diamide synthase [Hippea alviniae]|uniref:cobyrinate a,c-diamide synthase n=1 Tax=Hippea alviniae TaxID=1279027 RepID=UPI0003B5DF93|nr:cobyrinate a,c-diamide synthase [Hippea alviniae]
MRKPAFIIAADRSGSGKTTITVGLLHTLKEKGYSIAPFKCGPDYIDTAHLTCASGSFAYNLDSIMLSRAELKDTFFENLIQADIGIVEGVMGLFDGIESYTFKASTYDIAKILNLPVVIVIDASKCSASIVASVKGFEELAREIKINGVIINNIGSSIHEKLVRDAIRNHSSLKILGIIPKNRELTLRSRHLGLKVAEETEKEEYEKIAEHIGKYANIDEIIRLSEIEFEYEIKHATTIKSKTALIAYDKAFNFYYQNNLRELEKMGYNLKFFSPLKNETVDNADFVYLGGGYPELYAERLSKSVKTIKSIAEHINSDKPLIAECGGMMLLSEGIYIDDEFYKMAKVFNVKIKMSKRRKALGYVKVKDLTKTFLEGPVFGHEFHYSYYTQIDEQFSFELKKLTDGTVYKDGLMKNRAIASYVHFLFSKKFLKNLCGGVL